MRLLAFAVGAIALATPGAKAQETITVSDLRFRERSAEQLTERVRETVRRTMPGARLVDGAEATDLMLTGKVGRGGMGYRATLELRDRTGTLVQRASATVTTRRELAEAIESATADLLRRSGAPAGVESAPAVAGPLRDAPSMLQASVVEGSLDQDADAQVLAAWDRARAAEARAKDDPEEAIEAWREVGKARGRNPFRDIAREREKGWQEYAESKGGLQVQRVRDAARLREVLPLASVTEAAKIEMLVRFARAHGFDKLSPFVALLPTVQLRERAELSLDCEVKEAQACVQLGRTAEDWKTALDHLDRGCAAGAADVCAEVAEGWLSADPRDAARAMAALQIGCGAENPAACVRLARMSEEGDGVPASSSAALEARERACAAGDGRSCRRLAGMTDDAGRVADLLRKGCNGGDGVSCALSQREPAIVERQLREAAIGARRPAPRRDAERAVARDRASEAPSASSSRIKLMRADSPGDGSGAPVASSR